MNFDANQHDWAEERDIFRINYLHKFHGLSLAKNTNIKINFSRS